MSAAAKVECRIAGEGGSSRRPNVVHEVHLGEGECQPGGADLVAGLVVGVAGLRARFARAMRRPEPETAR